MARKTKAKSTKKEVAVKAKSSATVSAKQPSALAVDENTKNALGAERSLLQESFSLVPLGRNLSAPIFESKCGHKAEDSDENGQVPSAALPADETMMGADFAMKIPKELLRHSLSFLIHEGTERYLRDEKNYFEQLGASRLPEVCKAFDIVYSLGAEYQLQPGNILNVSKLTLPQMSCDIVESRD